jgi:hypothetical protein
MGIKVGTRKNTQLADMRQSTKSRAFNMPAAPINPATGKLLALGPKGQDLAIQIFTVFEEKDDYLVCIDEYNRQVLVAKPYELRKSTYDGKTVNDLEYVYDTETQGRRTVNGLLEIVLPQYVLSVKDEGGEDGNPSAKILAVRHDTGIGDGVKRIYWEDLNTSGRMWNPTTALMVEVVTVYGDYIACRALDENGDPTGDTVNVAKPYLLRKSLTTRDGKTYSAYTTDGQERTATKSPDTENQIIIQKYLAGDTICAIVTGGTGVVDDDGVSLGLLDANADGRMWGKKST